MDLKSKRLYLRESDWSDLAIVHSLYSEPTVEEHSAMGISGSMEVTRAVIAGPIEDQSRAIRSEYEWIIESQIQSDPIGLVGLSMGPQRYRAGEVHYSLFPEFWGKGFAKEALMTVLNFGFKQRQLHRISAEVAVSNLRSIKLLESIGMMREGRCREVLPIRGDWVDIYRYAILASEI